MQFESRTDTDAQRAVHRLVVPSDLIEVSNVNELNIELSAGAYWIVSPFDNHPVEFLLNADTPSTSFSEVLSWISRMGE